MTAIAMKRIAKDLNVLKTDISRSAPVVSLIAAVESENVYQWHIVARAPADSIYSSNSDEAQQKKKNAYRLSVIFTDDYPDKPPKISFITNIYSPLVGEKGDVCERLTEKDWTPDQRATNVIMRVLNEVFSGYKNNDDYDLNHDARRCLKEEPEVFEKRAQCPF